jgi:Raf kinase inhibitor-like YbhB/YbcL family protein
MSSPAFGDGGEIPAKYCGWLIGDNVSPALTWSALPTGTADLLLVMEDLDSPSTPPRIHAVAAFAPADGGLPEGALAPSNPDVRLIPGPRGPRGYAGPRPMSGHGPHHYRFHLYALDQPVELTTIPDAARLPDAVRGHVLASATLVGTRTS